MSSWVIPYCDGIELGISLFFYQQVWMSLVFLYSEEMLEGDQSVLSETGVSQMQLLRILFVKTHEIFKKIFVCLDRILL